MFILYKVEEDPEEKTTTTELNIAEESYLEIKKPKPSVWYFINFASERQKIYIGKEDLKKSI